MMIKESDIENALPTCLTKHGTVNHNDKHSTDSKEAQEVKNYEHIIYRLSYKTLYRN